MIRWANGNNQEPWRLCFILRKHFSIYIIYWVKIHHVKREATHLADRQAKVLGCSLVVSGWGVFHSRRDLNFTLSPTYHLSVGLVPSSTQRFIDRHLYWECFNFKVPVPPYLSKKSSRAEGALTNRILVPRRKASWINKTGIARSAMLPWEETKHYNNWNSYLKSFFDIWTRFLWKSWWTLFWLIALRWLAWISRLQHHLDS